MSQPMSPVIIIHFVTVITKTQRVVLTMAALSEGRGARGPDPR